MWVNFGGKVASVLAGKIVHTFDECLQTDYIGCNINWHKVSTGFWWIGYEWSICVFGIALEIYI